MIASSSGVASVGCFAPVWQTGAWVLPLSLAPGSYRVAATDGAGHSASVALAIADRTRGAYALRVPLAKQ